MVYSLVIPLLPHQESGARFLFEGGESSVLIGDEPRVGKTFTAIELERLWRKSTTRRLDKTLIVAPNSILSVWRQGLIDRGIPADTIIVVDKPKRIAFSEAVANNTHDYYIINYSSVRKIKEFFKGSFLCIIADEAHNIKGRETLQTKALKRIKCHYKIATTGTPADNKIEDFWSILNWLWKKDFSSYWRFVQDFCDYWENPAKGFKVITGVRRENLGKFWELLYPERYLRRSLDEVSGGMPPILYNQVEIPMGNQQAKAYTQYEESNLVELQSFADPNLNVDVLSTHTVKVFTHLQILSIGMCTVHEYDKWKKDEDYEEGGYWYVAQSFKLQNSPKVDWIIEYLKDSEEPIVIMCQHNDTALYLENKLIENKITSSIHSGITAMEHREDSKKRFQAGESRVFIGTFGTAREGIDLSIADTIIMIDRPWRTKWNEQAENRVRNLMKKTPVEVIDLVGVIPGHETIDQYRFKSLDWKTENIELMTERPNVQY